MITFLPSANFAESAAMLDKKRLGNQRVEARMILRWLRNPEDYPRQQNAGYTIMWRGYEDALCMYYNACLEEWARRGGQNLVCQPEPVDARSARMPPWLGDEELHHTHRSALVCKLPEHYEQFGWEVSDPKVEYLWPRPVEGREGEYELCPAFWKKKKSQSTAKASDSTAKAKAKKATRAKKEAPKTKAQTRKGSAPEKNRRWYPSRRPRRSPRLAKT